MGNVVSIRKIVFLSLLAGLLPALSYAGVFPPGNSNYLSCGAEGGKHFQVDVTLFPKTLRVNGTYLELKSSTDANDGFKVGLYRQTGSLHEAMLAVRQGYRPVLIENNLTYVCY